MYIFDTSPLSSLFKNYYRGRFPTLWEQLETLIAGGDVVSTREVARELEQYATAEDEWLRANRAIFTVPTVAEAEVVRNIYDVAHFRQNIELKKLQKGGLNADPFVIAKAAVSEGTVVTLEKFLPNATRIPNICQHFGVRCIDLEGFMEEEDWEF